MGVCLRYTQQLLTRPRMFYKTDFIKVFGKLPKFVNKGSLEGWVRRIMVNTLRLTSTERIKSIKKMLKLMRFLLSWRHSEFIIETINANDLLKIIQTIPEGISSCV